MTEVEQSKKFDGYLILDWKNKKMRVVSKLSRKLNPYEIPLKINIKINVPKLKTYEVKGEFTVPQTQVKEAILHEI